MSVADSNSAGSVANVNGHEVGLRPATENAPLPSAAETNWIIVKFDRFVDYNYKQELLQQENLEVHEHLGDYSYLCKYVPDNLRPIASMQPVSHIALYPDTAVPTVDFHSSAPDQSQMNNPAVGASMEARASNDKIPIAIELHPNPVQNPSQILEQLTRDYGAEHLDNEVVGNSIRVNLDPAKVSEISKIDSIRTIDHVRGAVPCTVRQREIMSFSTKTVSKDWKGSGETVHVGDTGFDQGKTNDVHAAFTGRVLAATTAAGVRNAEDFDGHGTHVAGSVLGNLSRNPETTTSNVEGTAPEAKLISITILGGKTWPNPEGFLTQKVESFGPPLIMNNSWGVPYHDDTGTTWGQNIYKPSDAQIVDKVMYENSNTCLVFAAGNNGSCVGRDGKQQQIGDYASAKNCITVGASYSDRPVDTDTIYDKYKKEGKVHNTFEIAGFSSIGPTLEKRMAPDVIAPGAIILSARSRSINPGKLKSSIQDSGDPGFNDVLFMEGTSQATPAVTGCVAVLRGAFRDKQKAVPTGALLKALIVHGAVDGVGTKFKVFSQTQSQYQANPPVTTEKEYTMTAAPNPFQGYGLVNINNSLRPITGSITDQCGFIDSKLGGGKQQTIRTINIPNSASSLTVTLAYTDLPGPALQNIISLSVIPSDGKRLEPQPPTDPMGRTIEYKASNVARIVKAKPAAGAATIILDVETGQPSASFAVVWTVT